MKNKERIAKLWDVLDSLNNDVLQNRKDITRIDEVLSVSNLWEPQKPKLKQLDQSIFDGLDEKWRFAAVDKGGAVWVYSGKPDREHGYWFVKELLDKLIGKGYDASNWQDTLIERESLPKLKQIDQSVFYGLDDVWRFAAINKAGRLMLSKSTMTCDEKYWHSYFAGDMYGKDTGYDTSNWQNSLIERESKPQLKQLDHSVFNGLDSKWLYAAIDSDGELWVYTHIPDIDSNYWYVDEPVGIKVGKGYDATNWQTSLIERETIELTGSELCKAMLARGDTRIMCLVSDEVNREDMTHVIRAYRDGKFHTKANRWNYATPINNQGEPLTSSDVGL